MTGALHVVEYDAIAYRRTWRGSLLVSFISPLLFLAAMGVGLGDLVNRGSGGVAGVSYLHFLAPGLLAATAMQTATAEMTFPIMGKVHWLRIYEAMLATPLTVRDVLVGEVVWLSVRLAAVATIFFCVMAMFGVVTTPLALLAIPVGTVTGLAFGVPIMAFSATRHNDSGFAALQRFVIMPLFLLSGAFFPIDQLPRALEVVAWMAPLAHAVAVTRGAVLGSLGGWTTVGHVVVLAAYIAAGLVAARWALTRRLVV
jgi:lipooligosaccharide transport system permease protein